MRRWSGLVVVLLWVGCPAPSPSEPKGAPEAVPSPSEPEVTPQASEPEGAPEVVPEEGAEAAEGVGDVAEASLARSVQDVACDLYRATDEGGNHLLSPYSIVASFAQLQAGARGETAAQLTAVFHWEGLEGGVLHRAIQARAKALAPPRLRWGTPLTLRVVNRAFGPAGSDFAPAYLDLLRTTYDAPLERVDFSGDPAGARARINGWVEEETEGTIRDALPSGSVTPDTRLALVNAIYFHGSWEFKFPLHLTRDAVFTTAGGEEVQVPMMRARELLRGGAGEGWRAAAIPYCGDARMVVILPDDLAAFEATFTGETLREILGSLIGRNVKLQMPRFEFERRCDLATALQGLGVEDVFQPEAADLTGIAPGGGLFLSAAVHRTLIAVDEEGTRVAATNVGQASASKSPEPLELVLNRPFLLLIESEGLLLFLGRVADPR